MRVATLVLVMVGCGEEGAETDTGDDPSPFEGPFATVSLTSVEIDDTGPQIYASAAFYLELPETTDSDPGPYPDLDACVVTPNDASTTTTTTTPPLLDWASAGEVTLALDGNPIPLQEISNVWNGALTDWPTGQVLSISATGGDVPAFDIPDLLTVTDAIDATAEDEADGSLTATWDGDSTGDAYLSLTGADASVFCWADDDGSFTVPAEDVAAAGADPLVLVQRVRYTSQVEAGISVYGFVTSSSIVR